MITQNNQIPKHKATNNNYPNRNCQEVSVEDDFAGGSQKMLEEDENVWHKVKRSRSRKGDHKATSSKVFKNLPIQGTNKEAGVVGAPKYRNFHVYRLAVNTKSDNLVNYLKSF